MKNEVDGRREIASRNTAWANIIARKLIIGVSHPTKFP